jgi:molybdopterin biosynthesis enzyme
MSPGRARSVRNQAGCNRLARARRNIDKAQPGPSDVQLLQPRGARDQQIERAYPLPRGNDGDCAIDVTTGATSIEGVVDTGACDLLITIGGSGVGRSDAAITALTARGAVLTHGIALQPGRTAAAGTIANVPMIALPGAPDQALSVWWTLVLPTLDALSGLLPREQQMLPLVRKVASSVGITELALLEKSGQGWMPIAVGALSLEAIARADAWLAIQAASEGFAAGAVVGAYMLRE